jgi:PTS system beta-glucosides-specific IIC component
MSLKDTAKTIVTHIGGPGNVESFTHCATRLRFAIKDESKINQDALKNMKEVLGVVNKGGQFQLVIGPTVEQLYNEITPLMKGVAAAAPVEDKAAEAEDKSKKDSVFNRVMGYVSGSISPVLPVLIGAGMINAVLAIATLFGLDKSGGTYTTWAAVANIGFTYLPVFVAFSAARKLRTNEYLAAAISLAMIVCFNQQEGLTMFGLTIPTVKYANCIIPVLLMVPLMVLVDKLVTKVIPAAAHFTIKPLIIFIITTPVMMFIFGPVGALIGGALANGCIWLMNTIGSLAMAVLSFLHPITVMFGMHYLFTPIMTNEVAETGATFVLDRALAANFAMAGAALAVGVKAKKPENKSVGFSSCVTALLSVTEPALYGCLIRLRKPLISACIAAGITGIFLGAFHVVAYSIASPCLLSLPIFIGGDSMTNFLLACVGAAMGFILGFIITYIVGFNED